MTETIGILSILEGDLADEAKRLWRVFETRHASKGVQTFDYPNVSFQGGDCQDMAAVKAALTDLAPRLCPFTVIIDGVDFFEGPPKTMFLNVKLTDELRYMNRVVNNTLDHCCETVFKNYVPERWRPHVTLAMTDLTEQHFARAWHDLQSYHPRYQQTISTICLVHLDKPTGHIDIVQRELLRGLPRVNVQGLRLEP